MNFIKNIVLFFKKILKKQNNIKMLNMPEKKIEEKKKNDFINSLKVHIEKKHKKKKVETLTCFGDGLGIQTQIDY